jgi:hypothetical protein
MRTTNARRQVSPEELHAAVERGVMPQPDAE